MNDPISILIINDEQTDVDLLTGLLRDDYQVRHAHDREQALAQIQSDKPGLIVLATTLPDADGCDICTTLKSAKSTRDIPVVFFMASIDPDLVTRAIQSGAADCLSRSDSPQLIKLRLLNQLNLVHEISEFGKIQHQFAASHYEQQQLLSAISSILIGLDQNSKITLWNRSAEQLFDLISKDVRGKRLEDLALCWGETIQQAIQNCRNSMSIIHTDDIPYVRNDGNHGFLGFSINPIMHKDGSRLGILIVGADITRKKSVEKQLLQSQKLEAIGQLAAGIAHEINTPIQFVSSNCAFLTESFAEISDMLRNTKQLVDNAAENGQVIDLPEKLLDAMQKADIDYLVQDIPEAIMQSQEGINRVSKIINAMKDFSHGSEEKTDSDLNHAIESTITVAQSEWKQVATMNTELADDLPLVPCLLSEFNQVILIMIVNAAHAIADVIAGKADAGLGGITITTRKVKDNAEIRVSDTGTGIPETIKNRIFDPFFTTKGVGKGTGQGLNIAHSVIVQKHGGTIEVESKPGQGTTFIILLPLQSA